MNCTDSAKRGAGPDDEPDDRGEIVRKQPDLSDLLAEAKHFTNIGELTEQTRQMKVEFSRLAKATMRSLKKIGVTPWELLNALEPIIARECKHSSTISEIFASLCTHASFFNYGTLEQVISKFEDQNVRKMLEDYKTAFESYCRNPLRQIPPNALANVDQNHRETRLTCLCIKLDGEWSTTTLSDIQRFKQKLASILEIREEVLNLCSIEEGCIMAKFLIPKLVADELFGNRLNNFKKQALKNISVLHMESDHPCYSTWISKNCIKPTFGKHKLNVELKLEKVQEG